MLIDMILQRALRCRGEEVLVLVIYCCGSNYNGTLYAFIVYLVDELRWFEACSRPYRRTHTIPRRRVHYGR